MPENVDPEDQGDPIMQASFKYLKNGADSLVTYTTANYSMLRQMLSKLTLKKVTIKGLKDADSDSLPAYKFSYDDVALSWIDVTENPNSCIPTGALGPRVRWYQDDFGYFQTTGIGSPPCITGAERSIGRMWSLKEIVYPDGGKHAITYANDTLSISTYLNQNRQFTYKKYVAPNTSYSQATGTLKRFGQGGPRVLFIETRNGYNDTTPDSTNFTYGPGHFSAISEVWFRNTGINYLDPFYFSGERGQASITYEWIQKKFKDNSAIKTYYVATNGPEPQTLYANSSYENALLQGNSRWNWGETTKVEYLNAIGDNAQEDIYYWKFYGDANDGSPKKIATVAPALLYLVLPDPTSYYTNPIYLNFTHKRLDSLITKNYFGTNAVTSRKAYEYNDSALLSKTTETSGDGKVRITQDTFAHELTVYPYSGASTGMKWRNMRSQIAQTSVMDNSNNGYSSTITTWKDASGKYLPDQEFRWRKDKTGFYPVPTFTGSTPQESNGWILTQTFDQYDQHGNLTSVKDANNIAASFFWDGAGALIDSITTRPNATTALTTKYAYDPNTFRLTSITDPNHQKTQFKYDPLQRLIETIMPDKRKASDLAYYYSRQGANNNDTFNPIDPNYIKTRSLVGPGFFEPFEYTDSPTNHGWIDHVGAGNGTMSTVHDNTLQSQVMRVDVLPGFANDSYAVRYPATGSISVNAMHLWVKVKSTQPTSSFRVVVRYAGFNFILVYYFNNGTPFYDAPNKTAVFYAGAAYSDGTWRTLERDLEQDFKLTGNTVPFEYVYRIIARGEYDLDDVQLLNHPVTTLAFADGLGRDIQILQYDQGGAIKSGTFYDALDRVIKVTKPFFQANSQFTRVDSVIAYANAYYSTQHPVYYDSPTYQEYDTGNYAYAETEYYPDPLNRVRHQYAPGTVFSRADTNFIKYQYGANAANEMGFANANSVFETRIFDENDVKTEIFTDTFGNKVAVRNDSSGIDNNGNTSKLATGFQYDIIGNLLKIAPPKAFQIANNNIPDWLSVWCTSMAYDTWGLLRTRNTPDAGTDSMYYDKKGNLRLVKDAKGAANSYFIYYKYDDLNRKLEEGVMRLTAPTNFKQSNADLTTYPSAGDTVKVKYHYDVTPYTGSAPQRNLKGRLVGMEYLTDRYPNSKGFVFYSYDANGNLEWIEQTIPRSNLSDGNGYLIVRIDYQYDALGKVTRTYLHRTFPLGGATDDFYVWHDYDRLGRLEKVFTHTDDDKLTATLNAQYTYWPSGQVKRLVLGNTVQGVDYLYNSRDWLTQINHQNLVSTQDPGGDGGSGVPNLDRFGQIIGYNKQWHIATGHSDFVKQLNGNISWTITRTFGNTQPVGAGLTGWVFKYDKANRLSKANWGHFSSGWQTSNRYDLTGMIYDRHGNLDYMNRYDQNNAVTNMDYIYQANTNKLLQVAGLPGHNPNNYAYDNNGNMIKDIAKLGQNSTISYDYRNLPTKVPINGNNIDFGYDGKGQRVSKNNLFYVPDANGRVLAVYDLNGTLLYWNIWGLDLIGQRFWKQ